jgi:hypothetical protein
MARRNDFHAFLNAKLAVVVAPALTETDLLSDLCPLALALQVYEPGATLRRDIHSGDAAPSSDVSRSGIGHSDHEVRGRSDTSATPTSRFLRNRI